MTKKLVELLFLIAKGINNIASRIEQGQRQKERDELEASPSTWWRTRFSGVRKHDADKADAKRDREG